MLADLAGAIMFVLVGIVVLVGVYSFVHAAIQRTDAYTAAGKLTKPVWLLILGAGVLLALLMRDAFGAAICACAAGVYLVDVRPKILEIQGKSR
jgi:TRAP-type mannitol/chloroaromatic compound transport system permease small subunit